MKLPLSMVLFCCSLLTAARADFYVDFAGGDDTNAGTSTGAAWKHCPGDSAATDTAGSHTITAGDIFNFKRGVTYYARSNITSSVSSSFSNPVTFRSLDSWGSGYATLDGGFSNSACLRLNSSKGVIVDSLRFANTTNNADRGALYGYPISSIAISNCVFDRCNSQSAYLRAGTNWHVSSCVFTNDVYSGGSYVTCLLIYGDTANPPTGYGSYTVKNCVFAGNGATNGTGPDSALLVQGTAYFDIFSNNISFYSDTVTHGDGIVIQGNAGSNKTRFGRIYQNSIRSSGQMIYLDAVNIASGGSNIWIYNNICWEAPEDSHASDIKGLVTTGSGSSGQWFDVYVFNNTLGGRQALTFADRGANHYATNNILGGDTNYSVNDISIYMPISQPTNCVFDYNALCSGNASGVAYSNATYYSFTAWQGLSQDVNSVTNSPGFFSATDFRLLAASPIKGLGADLSAYFTKDFANNTRTPLWSIGAFEQNGTQLISTNITAGNVTFGGQ